MIDKFQLYKELIHNENYDPLMSSHVLSTKTLVIYRCIVSLFCLSVIFSFSSFLWFVAFTVWNWVVVTIYFTITGGLGCYYLYHTSIHSNSNSNNNGSDQELTLSQFDKLRYIAVIAILIECVNTLMVDIVVWCVLFPLSDSEDKLFYFNFHPFVMHVLNFLFIYFDLYISNITLNSLHLSYPAFWVGLIYMAFQWIFVQFSQGVCKTLHV